MDGFFGIGFGELVLIAIVALIVLGPERLPSALREVAKFIRWLRDLSREFTDQFGDEFKALEDLNPRRILQDAITSIDEEEKTKEEPKGAKKPTTSTTTAKSTTAKPSTTATSGTKTTTSSVTKPKPVVPKAADSSKTVARENTAATAPVATGSTNDNAATTAAEPVAAPQTEATDTGPENRIAPPQLEAGVELTTLAQLNGHHAEAKPAEAPRKVNSTTSDTNLEHATVASHRQDGEETREG